MAKSKNRNIVILKESDLANEMEYKNFSYKDHFSYVCDLIPDQENEKVIIDNIQNEEMFKQSGLVYVFVIDGKILKIGQSITPIKKRIQSYNCGKTEYRISGTNGTTNYFILQSMLKINKTVQVFGYYPVNPTYEVFGESYTNSLPPSKQAENKILSELDKKPIGNTQK